MGACRVGLSENVSCHFRLADRVARDQKQLSSVALIWWTGRCGKPVLTNGKRAKNPQINDKRAAHFSTFT